MTNDHPQRTRVLAGARLAMSALIDEQVRAGVTVITLCELGRHAALVDNPDGRLTAAASTQRRAAAARLGGGVGPGASIGDLAWWVSLRP